MKLYEFAPTRSIRVRWTSQELAVPFESETVDLVVGEDRRPDFLALDPAGKLPVLVGTPEHPSLRTRILRPDEETHR